MPIDFDDPEVRLADMNGDGLQDIAKIRRGRVIYWAGRGEGVWGEGSRSCARGEGDGRYIEMSTPPAEISIDLDGVFLNDVDMDGASDIVQVRFRDVDVWFNRAGQGWTARTTISGTPASPSFAPRIRFADIDGSGTTDIIWANASNWEYVDPAGGQRPRLLVGVDNGLGADTTITYGSSADDYTTDLLAADGCRTSGCDRFTWGEVSGEPDRRLSKPLQPVYRSAGSPVVSTVVRGVSTTDRFDVLGREAQVTESQFAYHDGYYEGIEQEFRGFGAADAITVGDWNNPTVYSRTHFLQGRRASLIEDDRLADNPNEVLKGREVMTEVFDAEGRFLSTSFATITNRLLYTGLDGRTIHYAFVSETNELHYDTSPFSAGTGSFSAPAVIREVVDPATGNLGDADSGASGTQLSFTEESRTIMARGSGAARIRATFDEVDNLGQVRQQTAHGQVAVDHATPIDGVIVSHTEPVLLGDGSSWLWRTSHTEVTGEGTSVPLGATTNSYNSVGDLISATQTATAPSTYRFGGEDPSEGGAADLGSTPPSQPMTASTVYDAWGNAIASCAGDVITQAQIASPPTACLRFGHVDYDSDFNQLAENEHMRVGLGTELTYSGTWDRGLGAILSSTDPNSLTTSVTYDGLGRLTSVTPPNVHGCSDANPTTTIEYELTTSPTTQPVSRVITHTSLDCNTSDELVSIGYVDGLGRARAALATGDDSAHWVRSGITTLDKKGTVRRTYQTDIFAGSETSFSAVVALPAEIPYAVTRYDAFGRARGVHAEDGAVTWTSYHALSTDVCDPLDNDPASEHYRTCTTARTDGHGRVIDQVLRNRNPDTGADETYRLWTYYRADGAVLALVRAQADTMTGRPASWTSGLPEKNVVRTFTYDTVGRRISSADPDTDDPGNTDDPTRHWRYLFNRVGDLIAVRDPRGCGQNFYYDFGGRLVGEQYVSCGEAQSHAADQPGADNDVSDLISMDYVGSGPVSLDVVYHYDAYPAWALDPLLDPPLPSPRSGVVGRATGVTDRGQRAAIVYDDRGNVTGTARQMALISDELGDFTTGTVVVDATGRPTITDRESPATPGNVLYDETHTYVRTATFDHAGRPHSMTLPTDPDYPGGAPLVVGSLTYNHRGLPATASATIGAVTQEIVHSIEYLRDGLVGSITYGDHAGGPSATHSTTTYDIRRRPTRFTTMRSPDPLATAPDDLGAVSTVVDQQLVWDAANNLVGQIDHRDASEWPEGHRPQSVTIRHDALYRVIGAEFDYTQTDGRRIPSDISTDWRDDFAATRNVADPMRQTPAPMISSQPASRVNSLTWTWDYLANTNAMTDDQSSFYERSIGSIANGDDDTTTSLRPSALYLASNIGSGPGSDGGSGWVEVDYGKGGNVETMTVHSQCMVGTCADPGGADIEARRTALRSCSCAEEQHYVYRWDELNRLDEARRYDRNASTSGQWVIQVRQRYRYDASNQRTVKQTLDEQEGIDPPQTGMIPRERIALYVYPGDFERRGLTCDQIAGEYVANDVLGTETQYIVAGARTVWKDDTLDAGFERTHRLTVGLSDLIGTTAAVFDVRTGTLIESSTYYPNGARETFQVDGDALTAPEVNGFTGKEGDEEIGLVYFGERYLIPRLGRWASPDPLHVHAVGGGEALNSYHYIAGNLLMGRDPVGLNDPAALPVEPVPPPGGGASPSVTGEFPAGTFGSGSAPGASSPPVVPAPAAVLGWGIVIFVIETILEDALTEPESSPDIRCVERGECAGAGRWARERRAQTAPRPPGNLSESPPQVDPRSLDPETGTVLPPVPDGQPADFWQRHPGELRRYRDAMANGIEYTPYRGGGGDAAGATPSGPPQQAPADSAQSGAAEGTESGLTRSERRSLRSLQERLQEHRDKLEAYRANPDAFDNQGHLRNAPSPAVRARIIQGRVRHLEGEIRNFERQIGELERVGRARLAERAGEGSE